MPLLGQERLKFRTDVRVRRGRRSCKRRVGSVPAITPRFPMPAQRPAGGTDHQRGIRLSTSRVHQAFGSSCRSALTTPRAEVCESAPGPDFGSSIVKQRARRNSRNERSVTSSLTTRPLTRCLPPRSVAADGHRVRQKTTRGMGLRTAQRYSRRHSRILHARGKNTPFRSVPSVAKSLDDVSMGSDWKW